MTTIPILQERKLIPRVAEVPQVHPVNGGTGN